MPKKILPNYFRNAIFGVEDSLVSTVGVLFGVASSVTEKRVILLTAFVVIAVEALSMGVGAYLSEKNIHEALSPSKRKRLHKDNPATGGIIMYLSYFFAGFIPTFPYIFLDSGIARYVSVAVSVLALFLLGYAANRKLRGALEMSLLGGGAIFVGFVVGKIFSL